LIYSAHGMLDPWAVRNSKWKKRLVGSLWEDKSHRSASCFHVNSTIEYLTLRSYGLRNPVAIIPNGVDLPDPSMLEPAPWSADITGHKVLLYLGRLHPKKNLPALLAAWRSVRDRRATGASEWLLVIAGWDQNSHEAQLRQQARDVAIEESVHFVGPLFGVAKTGAYQHAEAFVLPSLSEGLPMVILEAWAYGKPVVMTPDCNLPEGFAARAALSTGKTAESIAETLRELFGMDEAERKQMGERGTSLVSKKFTWPRIAEEMKQVCEWAVEGGTPPSCIQRD
jgi:poly(glycerol-phosphate) alpha-glucosyltransferase